VALYAAPVPRQNRVTPLGEIVADPARGLVYGNRGCLHDETGRIRRPYAVQRWIACRLEFRGRRRERLMQPGRYTELFFLDEATAFAAGHRPCGECRRGDYERFQEAWRSLGLGSADAGAMDERLHAERIDGRAQRHHDAAFGSLPDGVFVLRESEPWLVLGAELLRWTSGGYSTRAPRPRGRAVVVTPRALVAVLGEGWESSLPLLHASARRAPELASSGA
jgi:hypothetical protein